MNMFRWITTILNSPGLWQDQFEIESSDLARVISRSRSKSEDLQISLTFTEDTASVINMTTVPTKIVLKSTTRMSLSERFSHIVPTVQNIRSNMAAEQQVSAANRRLAQQLANRPGINQSGGGNATALMYQQQQQMMMGGQARGGGRGGRGGPRGAAANKGTLKQRLGKSNIKNRLTLPAGRGSQQFVRGGNRGGRGTRGGSNQALQGGAGDYTYNKPRGRGGFSPARGRGRGSSFRGRGTFNRSDEVFRGGKGGPRKGRGGFMRDRTGFTGQTIVRGGGRGQRRGGGAGRGTQRGRGANSFRGRGGRGGATGGSMTAQDLDTQLDEYMSKTKSHLDSQLDAYMSQVA
ncbi:hypothetical protein RRG08_020353 [Elysia crispata]|uniref:Chromatin target of PRMT1 protein C-terminal domain-containing protein n=1 Tax=Elysia crispata TaxID=231223 RepID=A0AAE1DXE2_9GAST|nr:hypothetical protein RRG08_020353 [Elysia crispata]